MKRFLFAVMVLTTAGISSVGMAQEQRTLYVPAAELGVRTHDDIGVVSQAPHNVYTPRVQVKGAMPTNTSYSARNGTSLYGRAGVYKGATPDVQLGTSAVRRDTSGYETHEAIRPMGATPGSNGY